MFGNILRYLASIINSKKGPSLYTIFLHFSVHDFFQKINEASDSPN